MKPIHFKEATIELKKPSSMTDEECSSLWVWNDGSQNISCWKFSVLSGKTQPPIWVDPSKTVFKKQQD